MNEEWRDVKGYEGLYRVSNMGRVYSLRRHTFMSTMSLESRSRVVIRLFKNGYLRKVSLTSIIMQAFRPEEAKKNVKHKDGDFRNNRLDNLEFVKKDKVKKEGPPHRNCKAVYCVELARTFSSIVEAAQLTGVNRMAISACCNKRPHHHTAGGYHWRFADESANITQGEENNNG